VLALAGDEIRTKLTVIALPQDLRLKMARACKLLHVVAIPLKVPLQLGKRQIVSLKCE
jgi:hypothetical protein